MGGLDYPSYQKYYDKVIDPAILEYGESYAEIVALPYIKDKIWDYYVEFNEHCKNKYMHNKNKLLDRHKVVACYMFAILRTNPIVCVTALRNGDQSSMFLNERLALRFGMTLLQALICDEIESLPGNELKEKVTAVFKKDIIFPGVNQDDYKQKLLAQLYHTKDEANYNILAMAETLFLLENYNLIKNGLPEDVFMN